jgi:ATP-dependent Clp protease adaptor protein ClpS
MSKELTQLKEHIATRSEECIDEPRQYKVLLHNDDYTTMDFVVQVLESVFYKPPAEAAQIMINVHEKGIGVCGIYTAEIAETKVAMVAHISKERGFPLKCSLEEV